MLTDPPTRTRQPAMSSRPLVTAVALAALVVDAVSKQAATHLLAGRPPVPLLPSVLSLDLVRNPGAAFGLAPGATWVLTAVAVAVVAGAVVAAPRLAGRRAVAGLGLVAGGAAGNLTDRLVRTPGFGRGQVVDWIRLPHWPTFNLADVTILAGVSVLWWASTRTQTPATGTRVSATRVERAHPKILAAGPLVVLVACAYVATPGPDRLLLRALNGARPHTLTGGLVTFAAEQLIFLSFAAAAAGTVYLVRARRLSDALSVLGSLAAAFVVSRALAFTFTEQRPFTVEHHIRQLVPHTAGQSFPSDHATAAFALALAALLFIDRRLGVALLVVALLVGGARVAAGVHYPRDILGGLVAAAIGVAVGYVGRHLIHRARRPDTPTDSQS